MKIALIYPAMDAGFNAGKKTIFFSQIHAGLCLLSAVCKKEGFKDVELIDLRSLRDWDEFRDKILEMQPDVTGITLMSPDYEYAMKCIDIIKNVRKSIKTVVGGLHPTVATSEMIKNEKIDHIVMGEGELAFPQLLRGLEEGKAPARVIKGERPDLDELPFIDRELFDFLELPRDFFLPLPFMTILAGRGCNYACKYCSPAGKIMYGSAVRRRRVDNVIEELKHLRRAYRFRSFAIWDDCFAEDKNWIMEFCDKYEENKFDQPFICQLRADIICENPDMMRRFKKAGLAMASIGFESGNDRVLKFINKDTTLKQNLEAARICKKLGIKIWAYHMFGIPTETNKEALDTVRMIRKIKPYRSDAAFFTPRPGSIFYDYCRKNNLSLIEGHGDYMKVPEIDKPKIRNIDYEFMRKMAIKAKKMPLSVKLRIRVERIVVHKKNKSFKLKLEKELKEKPTLNKMAVLRLAYREGKV